MDLWGHTCASYASSFPHFFIYIKSIFAMSSSVQYLKIVVYIFAYFASDFYTMLTLTPCLNNVDGISEKKS